MMPEIPEQVRKEMAKSDWRKIAQIDWLVEDWKDWYDGIAFALWKIARRHEKQKVDPVIDFQI